MPGPRADRRLARLAQLASIGMYNPHQLQVVCTEPVETQVLLKHLHSLAGYSLMDPFCGTGGIVDVLRQHDLVVSTNDLNPVNYADSHEGSLQPCFYKDQSVDVFVTSPYFAVLDLALPLMVHFAKVAVIVHVPGHYLYDPTEPRQHHFLFPDRTHGGHTWPAQATSWPSLCMVDHRTLPVSVERTVAVSASPSLDVWNAVLI